MLKQSVTIGVLFGKLGRLVGLGNAEAFPPNWPTRGAARREAWRMGNDSRGAGGESNVTRPMHGSGLSDTCGECETVPWAQARGKVLTNLFTH